ncbi:MAG: LacI family transcriptional regulator [Alicyclobacillus shizuokensis]|nr:LacI family transcriptional regulator [Alicyclobacillus shizuokensis]
MTTIYDIAKRAGVSPATVSRVLNGYPDVREATRQKVQAITREMGYQPNAVARGLATKSSRTIGVFFKDHRNSGLRHPFFHDVLASFKDVVGQMGYDVLFFANEEPAAQSQSYADRARNRNVDGLLLLGVPRTDPGLADLAMSRIPCMSIDLDLIGPRAGYLTSDNVQGAIQAVQYLVACGHREIGFIGDQFGTKPGSDRLLGFEQALRQHQLPFRPEWVVAGDFTEPEGYAAALRLFRSQSDLPSAIFCVGDMMAIGAMRAARECGLTVGRDISIVGFDDVNVSSYVTPGLTTIRQRREEMGARAGQALLDLIQDPTMYPPVITVDTELVIRDSVAMLRDIRNVEPTHA